MSQEDIFSRNIAWTSNYPVKLEIKNAKGIYLYDRRGKAYMDLISGVAVNNVGHSCKEVVKAVKEQVEKHMHLNVYGEFIQSPQVNYTSLLLSYLPPALQSIYFVNSGSEAVEGALKLSKRYTGRPEIISFHKAYHGSTQGALSVLGNDQFKNAYCPLLPGIRFLRFNHFPDIRKISEKTAAVIIEPVQGEAGVVLPETGFLFMLRKRCKEKGALLIFDEVQTGFGRTGKLFAFQKYGVIPDILVLAKAMGGGMPLGAFISSKKIMSALRSNPPFGHITTFGGHPVSCAAALASLRVLKKGSMIEQSEEKGILFKKLLVHPGIAEVRGTGLMLAVQLKNKNILRRVISAIINNGVITEGFLLCDHSFRISPPLIITNPEIQRASKIILDVIHKMTK